MTHSVTHAPRTHPETAARSEVSCVAQRHSSHAKQGRREWQPRIAREAAPYPG